MSNPSNQDTTARADLYASIWHIRRERKLGAGKDGIVFQSSDVTAIKVFNHRETFERERDCYLRLTEMSVHKILGHAIPQLYKFDEQLLVVEMSIVKPPFLLDFASAYLDYPPEFSDDVMEEWQRQKQFQFGEKWGNVQILLETLKNTYGIYFLDATPGNIRFADEDLASPE